MGTAANAGPAMPKPIDSTTPGIDKQSVNVPLATKTSDGIQFDNGSLTTYTSIPVLIVEKPIL